ncbi:hypothetical protein KKG36_01180 [Patescibacteria group bacterium]|nr:hypothetical protein [Patescibacteria group bacterium]
METVGINVGHERGFGDKLVVNIGKILAFVNKYQFDNTVACKALDSFEKATAITGINISNCNLSVVPKKSTKKGEK